MAMSVSELTSRPTASAPPNCSAAAAAKVNDAPPMLRLPYAMRYAGNVSAYCMAVKQSAPAGGLDQANLSVSATDAYMLQSPESSTSFRSIIGGQ